MNGVPGLTRPHPAARHRRHHRMARTPAAPSSPPCRPTSWSAPSRRWSGSPPGNRRLLEQAWRHADAARSRQPVRRDRGRLRPWLPGRRRGAGHGHHRGNRFRPGTAGAEHAARGRDGRHARRPGAGRGRSVQPARGRDRGRLAGRRRTRHAGGPGRRGACRAARAEDPHHPAVGLPLARRGTAGNDPGRPVPPVRLAGTAAACASRPRDWTKPRSPCCASGWTTTGACCARCRNWAIRARSSKPWARATCRRGWRRTSANWRRDAGRAEHARGGGSGAAHHLRLPGSESDLLSRGAIHGGSLGGLKARLLLRLLLAAGYQGASLRAEFACRSLADA